MPLQVMPGYTVNYIGPFYRGIGSFTRNMNDSEAMDLVSGIAAFEAKEFRRALQLLQPMAEKGSADAQYRCAIMMQNGLGVVARPEAAAEMMKNAVQQGFGLAQHSLGVMYLFGEGVEQDSLEAIRLLELAGANGLAGAWTTLGLIYKDGQGVEVDIPRARECYEKAGYDPDEFV